MSKISPIIGLEVHVELKTKSKMFCGCDAAHFHVAPNTHTCPVCLGLPGALPVPNLVALQWCIKIGLALNCSVNKHSFFERKNYFYPDLAKGYQISQYQQPLTVNGHLTVTGHPVRINRVHMEEDTGKSVHQNGETLIDYNRAGVPLVEIVTEPDITSPQMAKDYLNSVQQIIRYLGVSDADIEKGSMRCEPTVNLKIETDGQAYFTPIVEIKNVASLTGVQNAIQYELDRQLKDWQETGTVKSPGNKTTRGWDADRGVTFLQREKEGSSDYRYFPEPDIPPLEFNQLDIDQIKATIPELPGQKSTRYQQEFGLSGYDADLIAQDQSLAQLFDQALGQNPKPEFAKAVANLVNSAMRKFTNDFPDKSAQITPDQLSATAKAALSGEISSTVAKDIVYESANTGKDPLVVAKDNNLLQVSDSVAIEKIVQDVIDAHPKAVEDYRKNPMAIGFLVGQVMKVSGGSANPQLAREVLEKLLGQP